MTKLFIIFSILFGLNSISKNVSAEVNINLLKQKYQKCKNITYRHDCFDNQIYSDSMKIGYFRNNDLWDGLFYQNNILIFEFTNGKRISKSSCRKAGDGWYNCPSGNRYKSIDTGYLNEKGRQGKFRVEYKNGSFFEGYFKDGERNGYGMYVFSKSGNKYEGEYKNNQKHGFGTFTWSSGAKYVGNWEFGTFNGQGKMTYKDGVVQEGIWKKDKFMYANIPSKLSNSKSNTKLDKFKKFCSEIGLTLGTEKFGDCVLEAMKKG